MTILVKRINGSTIQVVNGNARLRASLEVFGKATVVDSETSESFEVHEVGGEILVLTNENAAIVKTIADSAIEYAARLERKSMTLTPEQNLNAIKMVVLAIQELLDRNGKAPEHDPEDPDASMSDLRLLAHQYGGGRVSLEAINAAIATPISGLFPQFIAPSK